MKAKEQASLSLDLAEKIKPILGGRGPEVQGAVLAELVSLWAVGHHPAIREQIVTDWLRAVHDLMALNDDLWKKTLN